jgi:hypothetical protein
MYLVVREHSFEISYPMPYAFLGRVNREWYCVGTRVEMKTMFGVTAFLPPRRTRDVLALTIRSESRDAEDDETVLVSSWDHRLGEAWNALQACGVTACGSPPPSGV